MAFFKPDKDNFWEGNVTKFGLSPSLAIVDPEGNQATYPNGAIIDGVLPYWQTKDWATPGMGNYILNSVRKIYTYLGGTIKDLTNSANEFNSLNTNITSTLLGNPIHTKEQIINYIRGADVFDQDKDGNTTENRIVITGDVLHSEPIVFKYSDTESYVFFGSNDGMLHAVKDSDGKEAWAFIPPDLLPKLKNIIEDTGHQYYVDSSPKIYFKDDNKNGIVDTGDRVVLVCGERKGGSSYFALDITVPESPQYLWRIDNSIITELGQSWSEPQFGLVKTSSIDDVGTPVFFIGAGYSSNNSSGKAILAIKTLTGEVLKTFNNITTMNYSIASNVVVVDANDNGFVDKVYVGDLGGQLWRLGKFSDSSGALTFPNCDENINNWVAQIVFVSDSSHVRKFYYPPSLTLEKGYDLLFVGSGDRENSCSTSTTDRFYCIRDKHASSTYYENDLVDMTNPLSTEPSLDNLSSDVNNDGRADQGWFIQLAAGEKVLAENTVFYKTVYLTTFTPNPVPCVPGGDGRVYALQYKTSGNVLDFDKDGTKDRSTIIGGGIPSKTVIVITDTLVPAKMLISVGSTNPDPLSVSFAAGVISIDPLTPDVNFIYRWWRELLNL
jgi:type IV pilus assembly protein PilY1